MTVPAGIIHEGRLRMAEVVTVIAGGCSAGTVDNPPSGRGLVIGVNDAVFFAQCHVSVSMDRLWAENRWRQSPRGAHTDGGLVGLRLPTFLRRSAIKNLPMPLPSWATSYACDHEVTAMSDVAGVLNGTNSGLVALNLAYQLKPTTIVMLGFDMKAGPGGRPHWWPDYPWAKPGGATSGGKFNAWARQFSDFAYACRREGIQVEQHGDTQIPGFKEWVRR